MTITKVSDLLTSSDTADLGLSTIFPMYQTGNSSTLLGKSAVQVGDKIYLRSGAYTAPANADPSVLDMDHLKLYNTKQVDSQIMSDNTIFNIVSNGSTLVATGIGKISYSTDNGITWSTAVNVGYAQNNYSCAVWTGARFVITVGGSGGSGPIVYQSTNGETWTASTGTLPSTTNNTSDMITDKQGRVLILNGSTTAYYSTDHGVSFTSITLSGTAITGFVINGLWVFLQNNSLYYSTAPVATPTVGTARTLPATTSSISRNLCCSNGVNLGVYVASGVAYTTTDGITWSTGTGEMSYNVISVHYDGSRFYFTPDSYSTVDNSQFVRWVPYVVYESANLNTFREMFLTPARISIAPSFESVSASAVGANNGRLFFATQGTNTLPPRYLDYKTTADFIGTNKVFRIVAPSDGISAIYYWRIK